MYYNKLVSVRSDNVYNIIIVHYASSRYVIGMYGNIRARTIIKVPTYYNL